jgi:hypothetical protein
VSSGNVTVGGTVAVSSGNVTVNSGTVAVSSGNITVGGTVAVSSGNVAVSSGNITVSAITANTTATPISVVGFAARPVASFNTPSGNVTYSIGNLIANSATAGSVTPLVWTVGRISGGSGMIRRVRMSSNSTITTNANYRLHLYRSAPSVANGDNGTFSSNGTLTYMGSVDTQLTQAFTDGSSGVGVPNAGGEINFILPAGQTTINGLIEARSARSRVGSESITVELEILQN